MKPKFCRDCKFYSKTLDYHRCSEPRALSNVTAEPGFAEVLRRGPNKHPDYCGSDAEWFVQAQPLPPTPEPPMPMPQPTLWRAFWRGFWGTWISRKWLERKWP